MFSLRSVSKNIQRLIAVIGLCAYLFLGLSSPETISVLLLQLKGPHEVSISTDVQGREALVFHHHQLNMAQTDAAFHHTHPVEPDHIFLLPGTLEQGQLLSSTQPFEFKPVLTQKIRTESTSYPFLKPPELLDPRKLAQPPPENPETHRPNIVELRRTTVLII